MLAMPKTVGPWSLGGQREMVIKNRARVMIDSRYVRFRKAEIAMARQLLPEILSLIFRLRAPPVPA